MLSPALLALALVLFLVLLAPVGRLRRSGWSSRASGAYLVAMLVAGLLAAELPSIGRYLGPILALAYVTPYVAARLGIGRSWTQPGPTIVVERPAIKHVRGPARDVPPAGAATVDDDAAPVTIDRLDTPAPDHRSRGE